MRFDNIDKMCSEAVENFYVPSAVCAIGEKDGVYYKKAFGYSRVIMNEDRPDGVFAGPIPADAVPATLDTVYDMASLSKLISTTMVVLRLIEEGEMTLPDTVRVRVSCTGSRPPRSGQNIALTDGGAFDGKTVVPDTPLPGWAKSLGVNEDGDIVLKAKSSGFMLIVK